MYDSKAHGTRLPPVGGGDRGDLRFVRTLDQNGGERADVPSDAIH